MAEKSGLRDNAEDGTRDEDDGAASTSESNEAEFLAKTRGRRSRAGALMASLINEEADDELALLFAEQDDDEEFDEEDEDEDEEAQGEGEGEEGGDDDEGGAVAEDVEDMQIEESSGDEDEEDKGADAGGEDFAGEAELERQAKAERLAKKRKERDGMRIAGLQRKKVKIDPSAQRQPPTGGRTPTIPPARPRKKSERISWLPTTEDGPLRSSSRRQTMQNKELTHARLKDNAQRRERQIQTMKEAAVQKAKTKPKQMTQADRLAEAAKTERLNSKSLNRWEEMEKRRAEDQRAKLEALHNRRLDGPVATSWSGIARWVNDRLAQVGHKTYTQASEAEAVKRRKSKAGLNSGSLKDESKEENKVSQGGEDAAAPNQSEVPPGTTTPSQADQLPEKQHPERPGEEESRNQPPEQTSENPREQPSQQPIGGDITAMPETTPPAAAAAAGPQSFLDGIHLYASMNEGTESTLATAPAPDSTQTETTPQQQPLPATESKDTLQPSSSEQPNPPNILQHPSEPLKTEISSRNCVVLDHFDDLPAQNRGEYSIFFNPRKPQKLQKTHHDLCPITSLPARHRDPQTGLAYANSRAYREIRQLISNRYAWSGMLGCFVGPVGVGARGVPERFLLPNAAPPALQAAPGSGSGSGSGPPAAAHPAAPSATPPTSTPTPTPAPAATGAVANTTTTAGVPASAPTSVSGGGGEGAEEQK